MANEAVLRIIIVSDESGDDGQGPLIDEVIRVLKTRAKP
jgi:hypothetical protein